MTVEDILINEIVKNPFIATEEYLKETVTIDEIVKPIYNLKDA
jgi:hypothetical protein